MPADTVDSATDLLQRIGDRDPTAWEEILRRYGKLVSATVRSFRLQEADALDAVQMTWLRLAENAHRVKFPERLGGWLATTARHECLYILRQSRIAAEFIDMQSEIIPESSVGPEQHVVDADTSRWLWKLVDELSPRRRILLRELFREYPRPYTDVADVTGVPPGGIGPTRARALRQLRSMLDEHEWGA
ncbi:MAG: sigma-70 family RNA polymerase sigma factor [Pseudonocardiales bacterium]|nr:sigma-70 family RNA polymerase sigma factor [Pseudonocardiales bacterium]